MISPLLIDAAREAAESAIYEFGVELAPDAPLAYDFIRMVSQDADLLPEMMPQEFKVAYEAALAGGSSCHTDAF